MLPIAGVQCLWLMVIKRKIPPVLHWEWMLMHLDIYLLDEPLRGHNNQKPLKSLKDPAGSIQAL